MQDSHKYVGHLRSRETTKTARPTASHLHLIEIKSYSLKLSYWVVAKNYVMSMAFIPNQSCGCGVDAHIRDHYNQFINARFDLSDGYLLVHTVHICEVELKCLCAIFVVWIVSHFRSSRKNDHK